MRKNRFDATRPRFEEVKKSEIFQLSLSSARTGTHTRSKAAGGAVHLELIAVAETPQIAN